MSEPPPLKYLLSLLIVQARMVSGAAIATAERISIENNEFINEMKQEISLIYDLMSFFFFLLNFLLKFIRVIWRYFAYFDVH